MAISELGVVVKAERTRRKLSQAAFAQRLNCDGQTISNLETGRTRTLQLESLRLLQEQFGVDAAALMGDNVERMTGTVDEGMVWVDLYDRVPASAKEWVPEGPESRVRVSADLKPTFVVICRGDCMRPAIRNGERVVGSQQEWENDDRRFVPEEDYVVCLEDGRVTLKRAAKDSQGRRGWFRLEPVNPAFAADAWDEELTNVRWAAKVTAVLRR